MNEAPPISERVLVAGIGNIFEGDDGFGVEVLRLLGERSWPPGVDLEDFGIRGYDLAYALTAGYGRIILVDATRQGHLPGTLYLLELDLEELRNMDSGGIDPHRLNPVRVLQMAQTLGGVSGELFLVGCEPAGLANENGEMGLSEQVRHALPQAQEMVTALVREALGRRTKHLAGTCPVERRDV